MIEKGDKVFYTDNYKGTSNYSFNAVKIIQGLELIPFLYLGIGSATRKNSPDKEIRDDFWSSKLVVLVLGKEAGWRAIEDNWAIPEMKHTIAKDIKCLIYTTSKLTTGEITNLDLPCSPIQINDEDHFRTVFEQDLRELMTPS